MNIIVPCKNLNETAVSAGILPFSGLHALKVFNGAFTSYHKLCQALRFMVKKRFSGKTAIYTVFFQDSSDVQKHYRDWLLEMYSREKLNLIAESKWIAKYCFNSLVISVVFYFQRNTR